MGKQEKQNKSETLNQLYREFSRQKYNKYKHQFPKMRESEIVSRIIKEWDSMDREEKQRLSKVYYNNKFLHKKEPSEPDSAHRSVEKVSVDKKALEKTAQKSVSAKIESKEEGSFASYADRQAHSDNGSSRRSLDSGSVRVLSSKTKKLSAMRNNYISFFKFYYAKYHKQHENWSSEQISKVISLLWQKQKKQFKKGIVKKENVSKDKPINGRNFFRRTNKLLSAKQVKTQWNRLPKESKILWSQPNKTFPQASSKKVCKMVIKSGGQQSVGNVLSFLNKRMG